MTDEQFNEITRLLARISNQLDKIVQDSNTVQDNRQAQLLRELYSTAMEQMNTPGPSPKWWHDPATGQHYVMF